MVEIAHLATLKQYFLRFLNFMTVKRDAETGLCNSTILEAQPADKALMTIVCDLLMEKGWGFDNALHEVTFICAEINTLLQARPKLPKQTFQRLEGAYPKGQGKSSRPNPYPGCKGGKGLEKQGKGSKSGGKVSWVTEATVNGQKQQLCMRFQTGKCDLGTSCRFHHDCAYPLQNCTSTLCIVKTHLEECTTRYLGFKCFLFSVYRVYPEVEDGRGTFDLVCAFAVLFGVLEAWKCFADS